MNWNETIQSRKKKNNNNNGKQNFGEFSVSGFSPQVILIHTPVQVQGVSRWYIIGRAELIKSIQIPRLKPYKNIIKWIKEHTVICKSLCQQLSAWMHLPCKPKLLSNILLRKTRKLIYYAFLLQGIKNNIA